jgi:hypothetical protein
MSGPRDRNAKDREYITKVGNAPLGIPTLLINANGKVSSLETAKETQ